MVVPRSAFPGIFADLGKLCCKSKDEIDGTWHFSYLSCILNPDLQKKRREVGGPACVLCEYRCLSRPEGVFNLPETEVYVYGCELLGFWKSNL